jgi:glycosyltransferase involved in cell wall biosynthesis
MRILFVHNFYGSSAPSGENQVFKVEKDLLIRNGHSVFEFTRNSDEIRNQGVWGTLKGAFATAWNPWSVVALKNQIRQFQPDVIHVHNTFPLISPSVFYASVNIPFVLTMHNYRLFCPAAIPVRKSKVCTDCMDRQNVLPAMIHGCYRNSRVATAPLAINVAMHRSLGTWEKRVNAFIALTDFQRDLLIKSGLPPHKVFVKPNFFPGNPEVISWNKREEFVVYVGRLSAEKGLRTLINAWVAWGENAPELKIIGDGEMRSALQEVKVRFKLDKIKFLGKLESVEAQNEISKAKLMVLPSEWFEGFPMVIREAFAFGTPVAASNLGSLPSIVKPNENGILFESGNSQSIYSQISTLWSNSHKMQMLSEGARGSFEELYNEKTNYESLMHIYSEAIDNTKKTTTI